MSFVDFLFFNEVNTSKPLSPLSLTSRRIRDTLFCSASLIPSIPSNAKRSSYLSLRCSFTRAWTVSSSSIRRTLSTTFSSFSGSLAGSSFSFGSMRMRSFSSRSGSTGFERKSKKASPIYLSLAPERAFAVSAINTVFSVSGRFFIS